MTTKKPGKKLWIQKAIKHKGKLHEELGIKEGKKIPAKRLVQAAKSKNPTIRREAVLAETLEKLPHRGRKKKTTTTKLTVKTKPKTSKARTKTKPKAKPKTKLKTKKKSTKKKTR